METFKYEIWQDGMMVAAVEADDQVVALREALSYASGYRLDGPCEMRGPGGTTKFSAIWESPRQTALRLGQKPEQ